MAAGLGFKTFTTGEVLTAADTNGYLMQGILVFASAAARDAAITSPQEGQFAYLKDTNVTTYYTGSAWANVDTTGMTNPMTTTGDIVYASSGSTPGRIGIGSTGNVLTVAGGIPSWAAPASGGGMTELSTTTFSGTTTTVTSINQSYKHLLIQVNGMTDSGNLEIRLNGSTTGAYLSAVSYASGANRINGQCGPTGFSHNASTTNSDISTILWVYSYSDTTRDKPISASGFFNSTFPDPISVIYGGYFNSTSAISSIDFVTGNSTSTGTIRIWGVS